MHSELGMSSRTARIFLSSTFRDFAEERDLLVRKVFPELRRRCRERQVELIDVDLRWGITEKQAQRGEVMPICMAEIDRSRPYFMGFIGERYGWVPEKHQYDPSLLREQPWLVEHRGGKSVTELEMLHGVLNNPAMAGRAFFYFRNPAYSLSKGGAYLSESSADKAKLEQLKDRIRHSRFPVLENYASPEALAQRVQEDLWRLIDESFPLEEVPDALSMERRKHEAYGGLRLRMYLGGAAYCKALDRGTAKDRGFKPVLITGASGGGKSALLANWTQAYIRRHPDTLLFIHYLGSGADAADTVKLVTRLLQEIAQATGDELKLESDPQKLLDMLPEWLARASSHAQREGRQWLLVFDGLDKVSSLRDLRWWPQFLPPKVKLIVSCLDGEVLPAARKRMQWTELKVRPLGKRDQAKLIKDYLAKYRKEITPAQTKRVQSHPLSGNPLFLRTLLEELRVFGVYEKLEQKLTHYLQSQTVDDLFERVLERIEQDTSSKHVRSAMEAIWASRAGLAQDELLAITGLVPATWAPIHNALDEALLESNGRFTFGHDYLRQAVEDRYLPGKKQQRQAHTNLAEWFDRQEVNPRVAEELPWQWQRAGEEEKLQECLVRREMFEALYKREQFELLGYWLTFKDLNLEDAYGVAWKNWTRNSRNEAVNAAMAFRLAGFLKTAGYFGTLTERLYRDCLLYREATLGIEHPDTLKGVSRLGNLLSEKGDYEGAEELFRSRLERFEIALGAEHPHTLGIANCLACLLSDIGNHVEAEAIHRRALALAEKALEAEHPTTLGIINDLGCLLHNKSDYAGAEPLYRRALEGREIALGLESPDTLASAYNLGLLLKAKGDYPEAEVLFRRTLESHEKAFGPKHPATLKIVAVLGELLRTKRNYEEAESLLRRALNGYQKVFGAEHPATLQIVNQLGNMFTVKGEYATAEALVRRALDGYERLFGSDHLDALSCATDLGVLLEKAGRNDEAKTLYERVYDTGYCRFGHTVKSSIRCISLLGRLLARHGDYERLHSLYYGATLIEQRNTGDARALIAVGTAMISLLEKTKGLENEETLCCVNNVAHYLKESGDVQASLKLLRRTAKHSFIAAMGVRYNLACYECASGDLEEAKRLIREAIEDDPNEKEGALKDPDFAAIREEIASMTPLGADADLTVCRVLDRAQCLNDEGDLIGAEKLYRRALACMEEGLGAEHHEWLGAIKNLGILLDRTGRRSEAIALFRAKINLSEKVHDGVRYNLACFECLEGNIQEAKRLISEHLRAHPEMRHRAVEDGELAAIRDYIKSIPLQPCP
ncbi:MAG: tetratricopeptide repeat protein [Verrucomicrobiota bacterium]